jgi:hypothetical protein
MSHSHLTFVTGHAGTGKTTQLMKLVGDLIPAHIIRPEIQSILAITHMHGARRRVDALLRREHPNAPIRVITIHSFALGIVNRWRRALGYSLPIVADPERGGLFERYGNHHASFSEILTMALNLLLASTVRNFIAGTYPLIIVDEFQDCDRDAISLVGKLAEVSQVVLAADGFQDLTSADDAPCEAIDWLETLRTRGAEHIDLSTPRRTRVGTILHTADCLRQNTQASAPTIDKFVAPSVAMLAWKVVQAFLKNELVGSCAVICPTTDPQVDKLLASVNSQLAKKGFAKGIRWRRIQSSDHEKKSLLAELGISGGPDAEIIWKQNESDVLVLGPRASSIHGKVVRFGKLTGRKEIEPALVCQFAQASLHADRSYSPMTGRFEVTTVHGAKNREFDQVFIFWGYRLPPPETRRKMLYNAVTRAKRKCVLLVLQADPGRISLDPALSLLGEYRSPFATDNKGSKKKVAK